MDTSAEFEKYADEFRNNGGRPIAVNFRRLMPSHNSPDRSTHLIHSYPAKIISHIPAFFLGVSSLSGPGDTVLDPFCGSGTVLLEALLNGRRAIGADTNPLARLIARVKTTQVPSRIIQAAQYRLAGRLDGRPQGSVPDVVNRDYWFYPHVSAQLAVLRSAIDRFRTTEVREFFLLCLSQCVKRVSLADPRLSVPVRLRKDQYPKRHWLRAQTEKRLRRLKRIDVFGEYWDIARVNMERLQKLEECGQSWAGAEVLSSDARDLTRPRGTQREKLEAGSIDLVITSPPYAGAQKYVRASSLSLGWLGLCPVEELRALEDTSIGREHFSKEAYESLDSTGLADADNLLNRVRSVNPLRAHIAATYLHEMRAALTEAVRVLRPNGTLILVAGDNEVCGMPFPTSHYLATIAAQVGLRPTLILVDDIRSRGLMTKRNRTAGLIAREWVVVFRKGGGRGPGGD